MKRLVFLVEGPGDVSAIPALAGRWRTELPPELQGQLFVDDRSIRIGGLHEFTGPRHQSDWLRFLRYAATRPSLGAILAVFDGDSAKMEGAPFCAVTTARTLAERGRAAGAGTLFSLAVVFLQQEYESILIAAANQLPDIDPQAPQPPNPEAAPRDAKGWLDDHLPEGYDPVRDQRRLTQAVQDWQPVRDTHRSFRRFENALRQLAVAVASGSHVVTPLPPPPPPPAT